MGNDHDLLIKTCNMVERLSDDLRSYRNDSQQAIKVHAERAEEDNKKRDEIIGKLNQIMLGNERVPGLVERIRNIENMAKQVKAVMLGIIGLSVDMVTRWFGMHR